MDIVVELTDEELTALHEVAEREGLSPQEVGRAAVGEYIARHSRSAAPAE